MKKIGGNIDATIQFKITGTKNEIGQRESAWMDALTLWGWLDYMSGDAQNVPKVAKIEESTHIFLCNAVDFGDITSENSRLICKGKVYEILLIDEPMELGEHMEIYLKFIGGQ